VLATASNSTAVLMAREPLRDEPLTRAFEPVNAAEGVMQRAPIASGQTAAFYADNGRMWRVDLASHSVVDDNGPGRRLWPVLVAGNDVLARTAEPRTDGYYWFKGVGSYSHVTILADALVADALRLGWITQVDDRIEVRTAPHDAPDPAAVGKLVATIQLPDPLDFAPPLVVAASIGDHVMAIQTKNVIEDSSTLYLVALDSGAVRQRSLHRGSGSMKLLANSATKAWLGQSDYPVADETQFDKLVVLDLSRTCGGTPTCAGLSAAACSAAPACNVQGGCEGKPTDPCAYTTEATCFQHVCAWDSLKDTKCLPRDSCADAPEDACRNTAGCRYSTCRPKLDACNGLAPDRCKAQPGCSLSE
jgi:hypothetical protein